MSTRLDETGVCIKGELLQGTEMFMSPGQIVPMVKRDLEEYDEMLMPKVEGSSGNKFMRASTIGVDLKSEEPHSIPVNSGVGDFVGVECKRETPRRLNLLCNGKPIRID